MTVISVVGGTGSLTDGLGLGATDDVIVGPNGYVTGVNGDGLVFENSSSHFALIAGYVVGTDDAIELRGQCRDIVILIGESGTVSGNFGIWGFEDDAMHVTNHGTVLANQVGILATGSGAQVVNYGTVTAMRGVAVELGTRTDTPGDETRLINFGTVSGGSHAVRGDIDFGDVVRNFGTLQGLVELLGGNDKVLNPGLVAGDVDLGDGNDSYDGRDGTVTSLVRGGLGNDVFFGNSVGRDHFDGGAGIDTLNFSNGPAVRVALDLSFSNNGAAFGDTYSGFENVRGSDRDDAIRGNSAANLLYGAGGNDSLSGQNGADTLSGGTGIDTLSGGAGNDTFKLAALTEIGDRILDFHNIAGDNDRFMIDASAFGGGLVAGPLAAADFRIRADNLAQDASDRFIFRTTDTTLWFDADGSGAGAAVLVADLQAGAALTAADIVLI